MPLREISLPGDPKALFDEPEQFLIFYSSIGEDGRLWCPDCRAVDQTVREVFGPADGPAALLIYVGQKAEWKDPAHSLRAAPWNVRSIPTIVKLEDGKEARRLVDDEINGQLGSFAK